MAESAKKTSGKKAASPKPNAQKTARAAKAPSRAAPKQSRPPVRKKSAKMERRNAEITGVVFISLGIFCALTLTESTGAAGARISGFGFGLFGFVYYLMSLLFIAYGVYTIVMAGKDHRVAKSMMVLLIVLCVVSLFHLPHVNELSLNRSYFTYLQHSFQFSESIQYGQTMHRGGGLFGAFFTLPLTQLVGLSASYLVIFTLLVIEAIVLTNLSLRQAGSAVGRAIRDNIDVIQRRMSDRNERAAVPDEADWNDYDDPGDAPYDDEPFEPNPQNYNFDQSMEDRSSFFDDSDVAFDANVPPRKKQTTSAETKSKKKRKNFDFPDFTEGEARVSDALRKDNLGANVRPIEAMPSSEGRSRYESSDWEGYEGELPKIDDPTDYDRWYDVREDLPIDPQCEETDEFGSKRDVYTFEVDEDLGESDRAVDPLAFFESTGVGEAAAPDDTGHPHISPRKSPRVPSTFGELREADREADSWRDLQEPPTETPSEPPERKKRDPERNLTAAQAIQVARDRAETTPRKSKSKAEKPYAPPPIKCLSLPDKRTLVRDNPRAKAKKLEETLASFGITAEVIDVAQGPVITRFELRPAPGVRVNRIANLSDDLALNLAAKSVRIEAPIPGKAAIGIEVPNASVIPVSLRELIEMPEFKQHRSKLAVALGRDIAGKIMVADIAKMPHLLIAGATGSGKSVCINTVLCSLLYHSTPEDVRLILVDPKVVELASFRLMPHLLIPVVTDPKKAASALNWAVHEMVERYNLFAEHGARDLARYNHVMERDGDEKLPQIVVVIDELADLMMVAPDDVEDAICRIAQMGRAAGIHLIVATQRPSSDIITGLIKANIPSRIAFAVASGTDSRIILDTNGAERLLGKGDMLFKPNGSKAVRVQGALVTDTEIESIKDHFQTMYGPRASNFDQRAIEDIESGQLLDTKGKNKGGKSTSVEGSDADYDELLPEAVETLMQIGHASTSMVQRRHRIGYNRAARMIDEMEQLGIVSAADGSKPRNILIDRGGFERLFGYPPNIPPLGT